MFQQEDVNDYIRHEENDILFPNYLHDNYCRRMAITYQYRFVLDAPPRDEWDGSHGTINKIAEALNIRKSQNRFRNIKKVLLELEDCVIQGVPYNPKKSVNNVGRPTTIKQNSQEEHILADWMEQGLGLRMITAMINEHRKDENRPPLSPGVVARHSKTMKALITKIQKQPQSNNDNKVWVDARYTQCKQLLIRLGVISRKELEEESKTYHCVHPPWFDPTKLPKLDINQIVWFDECHITQQGLQSAHVMKRQVRFPRDSRGKFDRNGEYGQPKKEKSFKYTKAARFCFGVASVKKFQHYPSVGKRCPVIDYTGKKVVSHGEYSKKINDEIQRVKKLNASNNNSQWIINEQKNDTRIWEDDEVDMIKGIGKKKKMLLEMFDIRLVKQLRDSDSSVKCMFSEKKKSNKQITAYLVHVPSESSTTSKHQTHIYLVLESIGIIKSKSLCLCLPSYPSETL